MCPTASAARPSPTCGGDNYRLGAQSHVHRRNHFGFGIIRDPDPDFRAFVAQGGAEIIQLHLDRVQVAEQVSMQALGVCPGTYSPGGAGELAVTEGVNGPTNGQPFGQGREHQGDSNGRGLEAIKRCVAAHRELALTVLTEQDSDGLVLAVLAVTDQGMVLAIGIVVIKTIWIGAGKAVGIDALGCTAPALDLVSGRHGRDGRRGWGGGWRLGTGTSRTISGGAWAERAWCCGGDPFFSRLSQGGAEEPPQMMEENQHEPTEDEKSEDVVQQATSKTPVRRDFAVTSKDTGKARRVKGTKPRLRTRSASVRISNHIQQ